MTIAQYTIHIQNDLYVLITDDLAIERPSVTISASAVITDLNTKVGGLGKRRVFYRDSVMRFDELQHKDGEFTKFAPVSPCQQEAFKYML
jgi:hypothetical protein